MESLIRFSIALSLVLASIIPVQEDGVLWSPDKKLVWSDFKGQPQSNSRIAAVTASGLSYKFSSMERDGYYEVEYTVSTFFYPEQSWYQAHMCDEVVLGHEQLHFDISELFARKMRRIMDGTRFTKNVKSEVNAIYKNTIEELTAFQDRYDQETNFSMNKEAQLIWNKAIKEALKN
ncbi:MAG: DUF922 domain-containing protein [Flavobacteriaceae bacterium]